MRSPCHPNGLTHSKSARIQKPYAMHSFLRLPVPKLPTRIHEDLYHFLDVVDVSADEARRPVEVLGEKPVNDQSNEQHDREIGFALLIRAPQRALNTTENTKV